MKHGVVLCAPGDTHVVDRFVCHNYHSAVVRGRDWKRKHPDHIVRVFPLSPDDRQPQAEEIPLVKLNQARKR